jgi:hypothetical protein
MTPIFTATSRRRVPPLSRRFLIGFATGALVMALATAGLIAALGLMAAPPNDDLLTWPPLAKADDCGYAISVSEWLSVPKAHDARAYVNALAEAWARRGWDVEISGDASAARLSGHLGKATQQVETRLTEDGLRVGTSGQQCAPPPTS